MAWHKPVNDAPTHTLEYETAKQASSKDHVRIHKAPVNEELFHQDEIKSLVKQLMEEIKKVSISEKAIRCWDRRELEHLYPYCAPTMHVSVDQDIIALGKSANFTWIADDAVKI